MAIAPAVQLSTSCLSFGSLPANDTVVKSVHIHNKTDLPIYFEFVTDQQGVFAFDRVRGNAPAMSSVHVTVTFQPKEASNYWRRVTCLVRVRFRSVDCRGPIHSCMTSLISIGHKLVGA